MRIGIVETVRLSVHLIFIITCTLLIKQYFVEEEQPDDDE